MILVDWLGFICRDDLLCRIINFNVKALVERKAALILHAHRYCKRARACAGGAFWKEKDFGN